MDVNVTELGLRVDRLSEDVKILQGNLDALYQLICGTFISLVQPGFALFEAGAIQSKNASNIVLKNLMDTFVSAASYYLIGYAMAYGEGNMMLGLTYWAGVGLPDAMLPHWYYQFIFANTAATIVSGAVAERCNFIAYLTYSVSITSVVYPIASSWVWNKHGWLKNLGFIDFSGSGVVHALGGACSLVGGKIIGPRIGVFVNGKKRPIRGHSAPMLGVGMLLILTGFLAFNGGSNETASKLGDGVKIAKSITNTAVSGSGAVLTALILGRLGAFGSAPYPYFEIINSALCGLVSVCAGCDKYQMWAAILCGSGSVFVFWGLRRVILALKIDDPVDAVATHLGSGFWGLLAQPLLVPDGLLHHPSDSDAWRRLGVNLIGALALVSWGLLCSSVIFGTLWFFNYLRLPEEDERTGNDVVKHGGPSYPWSSYEWQYEISDNDWTGVVRRTGRKDSGGPLDKVVFTPASVTS